MTFDAADAHDRRVQEDTRWQRLEACELTPDASPGVYVFADPWETVKYVGRAAAGGLSTEVGAAVRMGKALGASLVRVMRTPDEEAAETLERDLVRRYGPVNNLLRYG